jgi:eukaryotic-like serine/threonine-protein kinase
VAGSHRTPPPRRTFSQGQRALLWAAGVLGALAMIITIMILLKAQDEKDKQQQPRETITTTTVLPAPSESPAALRGPDWTARGSVGHGGPEAGPSRPSLAALEQTSP